MKKKGSEPMLPEISIGPHPAREDWSVLRVIYPSDHEHALKIGAAIGILLGRTEQPDEGSEGGVS